MERNEDKPTSCRSRICSESWKTFSSYSQESTIHSMSYIGKENLHWIVRIFWIIAFLFAFSFTSYLIYQTYEKWENDPMIVSFKERSTPTWQIPFPAITICPESKVDSEKFNFSEILKKIKNNQTITSEEAIRYEALYHVCNIQVENQNETDCNIAKTLRELSSSYWNNSKVEIASLKTHFTDEFKESITRNGVCFTSNMLNYKDLFRNNIARHFRGSKEIPRSNWSTYGYDNSQPLAYPMRVLGAGQEAGVKIILRMKKNDINFVCKSAGNSFRLTIHSPNEIPQTNSDFYRIPFNVETLISVEPKVVSTSDELKAYKPEKRQCYFPGEEQLEFFKAYTESNCKIECFTQFVLEKCGCVRFSMPHKSGTRICKRSELPCISQMQSFFILMELAREASDETGESGSLFEILEAVENMKSNLSGTYDENESLYGDDEETEDEKLESENEEFKAHFDEHSKTCNCLPACSSITYSAEISQSKIDIKQHLIDNQVFDDGDEEYETALVTIYFKSDYFIESKRSELYGWINFLSNCGGFLGLLMGGSFLSVIEILYHFVIKKVCHPENQEKEEVDDAETTEGLMTKKKPSV